MKTRSRDAGLQPANDRRPERRRRFQPASGLLSRRIGFREADAPPAAWLGPPTGAMLSVWTLWIGGWMQSRRLPELAVLFYKPNGGGARTRPGRGAERQPQRPLVGGGHGPLSDSRSRVAAGGGGWWASMRHTHPTSADQDPSPLLAPARGVTFINSRAARRATIYGGRLRARTHWIALRCQLVAKPRAWPPIHTAAREEDHAWLLPASTSIPYTKLVLHDHHILTTPSYRIRTY